MTNYKFGDVVLLSYPFTDQTTIKKRPAVVVSSSGYNSKRLLDVVMMPITSQIHSERSYEILIHSWKTANLLKPSAIKPILFTIEKKLIERKLGSLTAEDQKHLRAFIKTIID